MKVSLIINDENKYLGCHLFLNKTIFALKIIFLIDKINIVKPFFNSSCCEKKEDIRNGPKHEKINTYFSSLG